jgi:hypothetical protein
MPPEGAPHWAGSGYAAVAGTEARPPFGVHRFTLTPGVSSGPGAGPWAGGLEGPSDGTSDFIDLQGPQSCLTVLPLNNWPI